jgi:hypothetical protein
VQGQTNSASSEWFINLSDQNTFLDQQDGGFTVFAKVTAGTNVLNLFVPPIGPGGTNIFGLGTYPLNATTLKDLPVLAKPPTFNDLIYVDFSLRRDLDVRIARTADGTAVSWKSVANLTHIVEYASSPAANSWTELSRQTGTGGVMTAIDPSPGPLRFYRVKLLY